jgi:hypothetical protein
VRFTKKSSNKKIKKIYRTPFPKIRNVIVEKNLFEEFWYLISALLIIEIGKLKETKIRKSEYHVVYKLYFAN